VAKMTNGTVYKVIISILALLLTISVGFATGKTSNDDRIKNLEDQQKINTEAIIKMDAKLDYLILLAERGNTP